jgi:hypothetical protein
MILTFEHNIRNEKSEKWKIIRIQTVYLGKDLPILFNLSYSTPFSGRYFQNRLGNSCR